MFGKILQEAGKQLIPNHSQWIAQKEFSDSALHPFCSNAYGWSWITCSSFDLFYCCCLLAGVATGLSPAILSWHKAVLWVWNKKTMSLAFWGFVGLSGTSQLCHRNGPSFWPLPDASVNIRWINCIGGKSGKKSESQSDAIEVVGIF